MARINVWQDSIRLGKIGEDIAYKRLEQYLTKIHIKSFDFTKYPEIQLQGIDQVTRIDKATFDIKTRKHFALKFNDVLIELQTGLKQGWFYTSKADYIAYMILNKFETDVLLGLLIPLQDVRFRFFVSANLNSYSHKRAYSERDGQEWETDNIAIPIKDFPEQLIIPFIDETGKHWGKNIPLTFWR